MIEPEVVVLRQTGLGDLLSALPALRAIRRHFRDARIKMTCSSWLAPLAEQLGLADELVGEQRGHGGLVDHEGSDRSMLDAALAGDRAAAVIVALRVPERDLAETITSSGVPLVIGYRHPEVAATVDFPGFSFADHILVRWERLLDAHSIPSRRADLHVDLPLPSGPPAGYALIHPGAAGGARRWPAERWGVVARALAAAGWRVLVTGAAEEIPLAERICADAGLPGDASHAGQTDVLALAALVARAGLVLSCDTGIAHLAFGLRRPTVTLFGAVPPDWWGAPPGCALHRSLCKGGGGDPYAKQPDPALLAISSDEVIETALAGGWPDAGGSYLCPFLEAA